MAGLTPEELERLAWIKAELEDEPNRPVHYLGDDESVQLCRNGYECMELELEQAQLELKAGPPETIVAAAIRVPTPTDLCEAMFNGGRIYPDFLTISAPPPARHGTLLHPTTRHRPDPGPDNQGFLTSTGRYVSREEAHAIAVASGQPMIDHPSRIDGVLYSEDLW